MRRRVEKVIKKCERCSEEYYVTIKQFKKGERKFCSRECSSLSQRKRVNSICQNCKSEFQVTISQLNRGEGKFCSIKCTNENHRGKHLSIRVPKIKKVCLRCGNEFEVRKHQDIAKEGKYCSIKCYHELNEIMVSCGNCKKEFLVNVKDIKEKNFCSIQCFYNFKKSGEIFVICKNCKKVFRIKTHLIHKEGNFCTQSCYTNYAKGKNSPNYKIEKEIFTCRTCNKEFKDYIGSRDKCKNVFCSFDCKIKFQIKNKKEFFIDISGYKYIYKPEISNNQNGYILEHRYVMQIYVNRILFRNEIVHHIDGDKLNNKIENLQLVTISQHSAIHHKGIKHTNGMKH